MLDPLTFRHGQLYKLISIFRPRSIVEIGTFNGRNAIAMLQRAHEYCERPQYIGYDLFEDADEETDRVEFNIKKHTVMEKVRGEIMANCPWADVNLIKGNTRETLRSVTADFVFLDGGHSIETIHHDYQAVKHSSVVVFDDYYAPGDDGRMVDISRFGCNLVVDKIPHAVITSDDKVRLEKDGIQHGWNGLAVCFGVTE